MRINLRKCEKCWPPGSGSNHGDEQSVIILSWKLMAEKGENGPEHNCFVALSCDAPESKQKL